jgi:error-prone DNA polymerase
MVAAHATYRTRSAIRNIGKALALPPAELERIASAAGHGNARHVAEHVTGTGPRWEAFKILTAEIADLPRQIGQHSGGLIISTQPLIDLVPVQPTAMPGRQICQWDKDSCSDAGFLKIDVLGLGMLSCVEETLDSIATNTGVDVDLSRIDYHDPQVYQSIQLGDTMGTFQIESRAQIASVKRVKPENLHDLTVQVALIRPGPIVGQSVNPYIKMRQELKRNPDAKVPYDHPLLEPVLKDTLGAIIFQDQVIEVAMALAGFSAGEADGLRRAMTRKRSTEALAAYQERFIEGAVSKGVDADVANRVFQKTIGFSQYGFPKAHSAAFALLAYQSAWLREYYPAHWYTSLLNAQPVGFYPSDTLLRDAQRHNVDVRAVDVNSSRAVSHVEGEAIRLGLAMVSGVSFDDALVIEHERNERGPFTDLSDLATRLPLRTDQLEQMVKAGATACFGDPLREQLWALGLIARPKRGQTGGVQHPLDASTPDTPNLEPIGEWEQLSLEYATTGVSASTHPMQLLRPVLGPNVRSTADLEQMSDGVSIEIVAASIIVQRPGTAKGVAFLLLEDEFGTANVIVWPDLAKKHRALLRTTRYLHITGTVQKQEEVISILATTIEPLPAKLRKSLPELTASKIYG